MITQQALRRMDESDRRAVSTHRPSPATVKVMLGIEGPVRISELCRRRDAYALAPCQQTRSHNIHTDSMDRVNSVLDREAAYKRIDGLDGIILKGVDEWREHSEDDAIGTLHDMLLDRKLELDDAKATADLQSEFADTPSEVERASYEVEMTGRQTWPKVGPMYRVIAAAVVYEVRTHKLPLSERRRAELIDRSQPAYQRNWSRPYVWLEELVRRTYLTARSKLSQLLLDND